ncbi:MAG: hypothetical protein U9N86_16055 [Bacteroidota bacterium]|nr:hypothetical protein [Bacteroidota bacterium]
MRNKYSINVIVFCIAIVWLNSCSGELELVADSGYSPVVYCILNPDDSIHYLRIGKSYLAFEDARENPPHSDSLVYHEDFYAYLAENIHGEQGNIYYFEPSDVNVRDSGFFNTENLELLEVKCKLKVGSEYSLYIYSPELPRLIVGSTYVIPPVKILDPVYMPGREITILPEQGYNLRWTHPSKYAVYQPVIRIHYREGDREFQTHKSLDIQLPQVSLVSDASVVIDYINGQNFYNSILDHLKTPPVGVQRKVIGFDLEICTGGEEMNLFILAEENNNIPVGAVGDYSNLDGAVGIFASRVYSGSYNNRFSDLTINYLAKSEETNHLGFLKFGEEF